MNTQTFLIRCEYPDGDYIPTQEFVENIQEYFASNIMDGERGRLVVKPVYKPKRDPLYQECLDAVPKDIKERVGIEVEFSNFVSLVKRMRKAQDAFNISVSADNIEDIDFWHIRMLELEREVDEYLKKMEDNERRGRNHYDTCRYSRRKDSEQDRCPIVRTGKMLYECPLSIV